jgi:hypothetical protein
MPEPSISQHHLDHALAKNLKEIGEVIKFLELSEPSPSQS